MIAVFFFYNTYSYGIHNQLSLSKNLKHCNVLTYDGKSYMLTWMNDKGIRTKTINVNSLSKFISRVKSNPSISSIISTYINEEKKLKWFPIVGNSCNELSRLVSGVDIGITLNSRHLHYKLIKLDGFRNYTIDYAWRR